MTITLTSLQPVAAAAPAAVAPAAGLTAAPVVPTIPVPTVPVVQGSRHIRRSTGSCAPGRAATSPGPYRPGDYHASAGSHCRRNPTPCFSTRLGVYGYTVRKGQTCDSGLGLEWARVLRSSSVVPLRVLWPWVPKANSDCQSDPACQRTAREGSLAGDVQSRALATDILIGTGALIAGGGVLMYLLCGRRVRFIIPNWSHDCTDSKRGRGDWTGTVLER